VRYGDKSNDEDNKMKITFDKREIMKLAHSRAKLGVHWSAALKFAWFRAKQLRAEALRGELTPVFEGRHLVSFSGMVPEEKWIPMPESLHNWISQYGAE
jgi:hypothetical protein